MASIYKDEKGYWNAQILIGHYPNGKNKYKRFRGKLKREVQQKLDDYLLETKNLAIIPQGGNQLVGEYIQNYITIYKTNSLKPSSLTREYGILNNQIIPCIGNFHIEELTTDIIQRNLINALKDKEYSLSTIHKSYVILNEALNKAIQENKIIKNPCIGVELPSKNNISTKTIEILNDDEIQKFIEVAHTKKFKHGLAISLILYTGLRCGELCALKWTDIDFDNKVITVQRNVSVSGVDTERIIKLQQGTKTKLFRKVPINSKAELLLREIKSNSTGELIISSSAEIPLPATISKSYNRMLKYAGIEGRTGIHTLRHTFASQLLKRGVDIKIISDILGHSSVSFTYNTYVHLMPEQKSNALELIDY